MVSNAMLSQPHRQITYLLVTAGLLEKEESMHWPDNKQCENNKKSLDVLRAFYVPDITLSA